MRFLLPNNDKAVCRDLDPQVPYWMSIGGLAGLVFYLLNAIPSAPMHQLLHQRGGIQPISLITGGMVLGFVALKLIAIRREQRLVRRNKSEIVLEECGEESINIALSHVAGKHGILVRRWRSLLELWSNTESSSKVTDRLETDTEAFDLAQKNSYALPRILVWAIPILGFLGTVIGIGSAVGQFDSFLSNADDIDVLRDGLANVTGGLGTAFDTTFLALSISLIVMLPLAAVERQEQRLLTRIDLILRQSLLPVLPDTAGSQKQGVNQKELKNIVDDAFDRHLPNAAVLVEPAKTYAEHAAKAITTHLEPVKLLAEHSAAAIEAAQRSVSDQADAVKNSLQEGAEQITSSIESLRPFLDELNKVQALSSELDHELKQLQSGARLTESLGALKEMLDSIDQTLQEAAKPRRVVLMEQSEGPSNRELKAATHLNSDSNGNGHTTEARA